MSGFRIINNGSGFQVEFPNGYAISVVFGPGSNSGNKSPRYVPQSTRDMAITSAALGAQGCQDAEIAILDPRGNPVPRIPGARAGYSVGWQSSEEFARLVTFARNLPRQDVS